MRKLLYTYQPLGSLAMVGDCTSDFIKQTLGGIFRNHDKTFSKLLVSLTFKIERWKIGQQLSILTFQDLGMQLYAS